MKSLPDWARSLGISKVSVTVLRTLVSRILSSYGTVLGLFFVGIGFENAHAFSNGDRVQTTQNLNVRASASIGAPIVITEAAGSQGTIAIGPQTANNFTWWNVTWDDGYAGWSVQDFLQLIPPGPPAPVSPGTSSDTAYTVANLTPAFLWNGASGAVRYGLYISHSPYGPANITYSNTALTGNSFTLPAGVLQNGTKYRWDMTSFGSDGIESSISTLLYFQTPALPLTVTAVNPNPLVGSNGSQELTVTGSGFISGAQVRLVCPDFSIDATKAATFDSSTQLRVSAIFGTDPTAWTAQVINPGGASSSPYGFNVTAPVPVIASLSPASAPAGGLSFTLTVSGNTFHQMSVVYWNGASRPTIPVLSGGGLTTALQAQISATDIASAGEVQVSVYSPGPGGGTSSSMNFSIGSQPDLILGVDISAAQQTTIDWAQVKQASIAAAGESYPVSFVMIRASKGPAQSAGNCEFIDPHFAERAQAGTNAGLLVGAYHVAAVTNTQTGEFYSATAEADFFVNVAGSFIQAGNLRPALDVEDHSCGSPKALGQAVLSAWVDEWILEVHRLTGVTPILYCSGDYKTLLGASLAQKYDLWVADWTQDPIVPPDDAPWATHILYQYTASGSVSGIGSVDVDAFQGSDFQSRMVIGAVSPPRLTGVHVSNGVLGFTLSGAVGSRYEVQVSADFVSWSSLSTNMVPTSGLIGVTDQSLASRRFYRAVQHPE